METRAGTSALGSVTSLISEVGDKVWSRIDGWDMALRSRWPFAGLVAEPGPNALAVQSPFQLLKRPAILGLLAVTAISVGGSLPSSPFSLKLPGAWFFGVPAAGSILPMGKPLPAAVYNHVPGDSLASIVLVYGGLVVFMRVWYGLVRTLVRRPGIPVAYVAGLLALWVVPLLIAPPLFSRDVYSYVAQGDMVTRHISAYQYGPFVLGGSQYASLVDPLWGNVGAPYGPLFLILDGWATSISAHHLLLNVVLVRLMALVGVGMIAAFVPLLARSFGRDKGEMFALLVLNPIVLFDLVSASHNDALMLGLLLAGVVFARRGRFVTAILFTTLATAVKVPAALGVVYIAVEWARRSAASRGRVVATDGWVGDGDRGEGTGFTRWWRAVMASLDISRIVAAAILLFASLEVLTLWNGFGWSWVASLLTPGTVRSWVAPATGVGMLASWLIHEAGGPNALRTVLSVTRAAGMLVAAVVGIRQLARFAVARNGDGMLRAMGITFLAVVLLGPVVQPWYLSWGVICFLAVAYGKTRSVLIWFSMVAAFITLPGADQLLSGMLTIDPLLLALLLFGLLLAFTVPLVPGGSSKGAGMDEQAVPTATGSDTPVPEECCAPMPLGRGIRASADGEVG